MTFQLIKVETEEQLELAFSIRREVYIDEQSVPEDLEFDGLDDVAKNYLVTTEDAKAIGTFRMLYEDEYAKLQRFAVLKEWRGKGAGIFAVETSIDITRKMGYKEARLDAQVRAIGFYERFGFKVVSEEFMDAGIPHKKMSLDL